MVMAEDILKELIYLCKKLIRQFQKMLLIIMLERENFIKDV